MCLIFAVLKSFDNKFMNINLLPRGGGQQNLIKLAKKINIDKKVMVNDDTF